MSAAPRFSLRAAVTDSVSTGRREEAPEAIEAEATPEPAAPPPPRRRAAKPPAEPVKTKRPTTREGARGITVWVEPEIYRMIKLVGLDADMTTQDVMMEAIGDLLAKKGKGRIAKTR
ncbi:ribbon-helix-helix domain-containing protein [Methylobacterium sp. SD21]|uniref:ribbon-helix-helix domain-containing protein n=1 Tax=Methylobacterium litchii TaxID=3138810 RepID=UPI00313EA1C3